jgi:hypothetical protein
MLTSAFLVLGVATSAAVALDLLLGRAQQAIADAAVRIWHWLDEARKLSFLSWLKGRRVQVIYVTAVSGRGSYELLSLAGDCKSPGSKRDGGVGVRDIDVRCDRLRGRWAFWHAGDRPDDAGHDREVASLAKHDVNADRDPG